TSQSSSFERVGLGSSGVTATCGRIAAWASRICSKTGSMLRSIVQLRNETSLTNSGVASHPPWEGSIGAAVPREQLGERADPQLAEYLLAVILDRVAADPEPQCDRLA